jgi:lipid-binding SYLF domain-containing protein
MASSNQIPSALLKQAKCIAVIPRLTKAGFIVDCEHEHGVASSRTSSGVERSGFISMTGESVGLQAGGEHQAIILLLTDHGEKELRTGYWDLGAEAGAAGVGGVGAGWSETTRCEVPVLSYAHSSGACAGANPEGSRIAADQDPIHNLYGGNASLQTVLEGQAQAPASAQQFLSALAQAARN